MTLALLFPGQGVQHAGMLPWLEAEPLAAPLLGALAAQLGHDWRARCLDDAWATQNQVAQQLIVGLASAAWAVLATRLPAPAIVAGYSVGELAACAAAGVFDGPAALALAARRAELMDACGAGGLCAVARLVVTEVEAIAAAHGVAVAIRNAVDRCVIGGSSPALAALLPVLLARGAEMTTLRIAVASHTAAMAPAAAAFATTIEPLDWQRARAIVVTGTAGRGLRDPVALKQALAAQIAAPLDWQKCLEAIGERRPSGVLEVGPGTSLSRMWTTRFADIPARSVDEFRNPEAIVAWVRQLE